MIAEQQPEQQPVVPTLARRWRARVGEQPSWSTPLCLPELGSLICVARDGLLTCFASGGDVRWRVSLGTGIVSASPCAVPTNGGPLVVLGNQDGTFLAVDAASGAIRWRRSMGGMIRATAAAAVIGPEQRLVVFVASYGDHLNALDAHTGELLWRRWLPNRVWSRTKGIVSSPMVADVDGDGELEIVIGNRSYRTFCVSARDGSLKWFAQHRYGIDSTATPVRVGGRTLVILGAGEPTDGEAGEQAIVAFDGSSGELVWRLETQGGVDSSATIFSGPLGAPAFVQTTLKSAACVCADAATGRLIWRCELPETKNCRHGANNACITRGRPHYFTDWCHCRSYTVPLVAALNGDTQRQVIFGSCNGDLCAADARTGRLDWTLPLGGIVRGSPLLADLDGDGFDELIVQAGTDIHVFGTRSQQSNWYMFKGQPSLVGDSRSAAGGLCEKPLAQDHRRSGQERHLLTQWLLKDLGYYLAEQANRRVLKRIGLGSHRWKY